MALCRRILIGTIIGLLCALILSVKADHADNPPVKSKFYDFNEQIIDGEIRKPTGTYTDTREKAKFERLLELKKSFLPKLFATSRERIFK